MKAILDLASRLGLHRAGREWRGSCPACGYGSNAFTLSAGRRGRPLAWCASCQDKDAVAAAVKAAGGDFLPRRSDGPVEAKADSQRRQKARERALAIWNGAAPVTPDDPAGRYLASRELASLIGSAALGYCHDVSHPAGGGRRSAMVAAVSSPAGELIGVHRTYLTHEGQKANVEPVKASLGPNMGGAIRLDPPAHELVIGEGIESAASAGLMLTLPAWAAISAGNLARSLILPETVRSVVIAADADAKGTRAAEAAARRWKTEGRVVRIVKPHEEGVDFNDLLQRRLARGAA